MSGGTQTTTSSSEPWSGAQPALKTGIATATNLLNSGVGSKVYTGSTVTPWSKQTTDAMGAIQKTAVNNMGGKGVSGQYQDVINNGGMNAGMRDAMTGFNNIQGRFGYNQDMTDAAHGFRSMSTGNGLNAPQNEALNNMRSVANSQFNINSDPAFAQVQRNAMNAVNNSASAAGRYGSGVHQGNMAREIGDLGARQYQNWQSRKDAANSNMFSMGQQGQSNLASARSSLAGIGQQAMGNYAGANASIAGLGQQAFGNLGAAYNGMNAPANDLMKVGSMNEDLARRVMADKLRIFDSANNAPWEQLARFNAIASGAGQLGGTQTQTQPGQNPFLSAMGGLGLLGSFFG